MYAAKDYAAECDMLQALFERHARQPVETVLDLGCGTGNHAFPLAERGYQVTGVDRSEQMLAAARAKQNDRGNPELIHSEIQELKLDRQFDAVLMMFAVMGYLAGDDDLRRGLQAVRRHLSTGGLFVADFWYGPAVLAIGPSVREARLDTAAGELVRTATPALDPDRNLCTVHYRLAQAEGQPAGEESHTMRFFFDDELDRVLAAAQLELLELLPFGELEGRPDPSTWNATLCARAI